MNFVTPPQEFPRPWQFGCRFLRLAGWLQWPHLWQVALCCWLPISAGAGVADETEPLATLRPVQLLNSARVKGDGVFLFQIARSNQFLTDVRLADAPAFGKSLQLSRAQITDLLAAAGADVPTNFSGAETVRISRSAHAFAEPEALALLTKSLQAEIVGDKGELELNFTQPWPAPAVPDEPLTLRFVELPTGGIARSFIVRFEVHTARETIGTWQANVQARVMREVWVAHSSLNRGDLVSQADLARERRDTLGIREALAEFDAGDPNLELATSIPAGVPLVARSLKPKTVIRRGHTADALVEDGALRISMKVEALEDGAPGQVIRVRNPVSLRYLSGKVLNEQTILVSL